MNKLFGFFKQKLTQASIQNKKQLTTIINALNTDDSNYKSQIILSHLQKIKQNYMTWCIMITNEASTGLYYSQLHNRNVCLRMINQTQQVKKQVENVKIINKQMKKTYEEVKQIGGLTNDWVKTMSDRMQKIKSIRERKSNNQKQLLLLKGKQQQYQVEIVQNNKIEQVQLKQYTQVQQTISES